MLEQLKRLLMQKPFTPFQIVLTDGRKFDVSRFGRVAVGVTKFTIVQDGNFVHLSEDQIAELKAPGAREAKR